MNAEPIGSGSTSLHKGWKIYLCQVKVKLYLGPLAGELVAELPFTLMHPKVSNNNNNNEQDNDDYLFLTSGFSIGILKCTYQT